MKVGDTIECLQTHDQGTIVSSRISIGGREDVIKIYFGIDWYTQNVERPYWTKADSLKVINSDVFQK